MLQRLRCLLLFLLTTCALAAQAVEDSMAQRTLACTACHGEQGKAGPDGYYPRLAGKPTGYLYQQLQNFRAGRRHYALMQGLLDTLDDAYLHEIASYFANLTVPYPPPSINNSSKASAAELQRGRSLVQRGDHRAGIPACVQCHGLALLGVQPATPGLLGLPADYINAQLGGWQTGQRRSTAPDCMAQIASRLGKADIHALSQWLASQVVPVDVRPAERKPDIRPQLAMQCADNP